MSRGSLTIYRRRPRACAEELPFPTPAQLDLLKAATLSGPDAADAWRRWKARGIELEQVDGPSGRIFSQLWANREAAGIGEEDDALLKGVYRQALAHNAVTVAQGLDLTAPLADAGIPVVYLKGVALLAVAGGRLGLRRTVDVDALVPEHDAERAIALLRAGGARPTLEHGAVPSRRHACSLVGPGGGELDLHWWAYKAAGDDAVVFEQAREAALLGRTILIPSATELLVGAVANGFGGLAPAAPMRWIADSLLLMDVGAEPIDWDALVRRSERPGLALPLARGLRYLGEEFGAPVPAEVLAALASRRPARRERLAQWVGEHDPRFGGTLLHELELHRARRLHDPDGTPRDLVGHLAQVTGSGSSSRRQYVAEQTRRTVSRLRGNATLPAYEVSAPSDAP